MRKQMMPQARQIETQDRIEWDIAPQAFQAWKPAMAAASPSGPTISILGLIGIDPITGDGVNDVKVSAALRAIGAETDVTVYLNSPGGRLDQGISIYNLLREHRGQVTVKVMSVAASAASIVAMAGDNIQISRAGFMMVHNAWGGVIGNRNDLRDAADFLEPFDMAMAEIYAARTGMDLEVIQKKMDAETMINGSVAVSEGWADSFLPADQITETKAQAMPAAYRYDMICAKSGVSRTDRRALLKELKLLGTLGAADKSGTPRAAEDDTPRAVVPQLLDCFKQFAMPD